MAVEGTAHVVAGSSLPGNLYTEAIRKISVRRFGYERVHN